LQPKPSPNERCPSPPTNEVPYLQRSLASAPLSCNSPVMMQSTFAQ
jgi:hypothetical protein